MRGVVWAPAALSLAAETIEATGSYGRGEPSLGTGQRILEILYATVTGWR